ncbi:MAG: Fic family protein, partial [Pseudomonadota bacterium]
MPIFQPPILTDDDHLVLGLINQQKQRLRHYIQSDPQRWGGLIRRNTIARAIQGSNTIEGYHATLDDAIAAVEDEEPMSTDEKTWREIVGYRNAMTYVLQLAEDEHFEFHSQLFRSLHFMMLQHELSKWPGRWRPGEIYVVREETDEIVYTGPDFEQVPPLVDELVDYLNGTSNCPIMVKAAMAHLNLVMIHPFKDGNGRMARALQTLVLSRDGVVSPLFSSIEEWLGRNTTAYYEVLAETGQGRWNPQNNTHQWIRFNLRAHFQQAHTIVKRNEWYAAIYREIEKLQIKEKLPDRTFTALMDGAVGQRVRAGIYRQEHDISDVVASRDLKRLSDL